MRIKQYLHIRKLRKKAEKQLNELTNKVCQEIRGYQGIRYEELLDKRIDKLNHKATENE